MKKYLLLKAVFCAVALFLSSAAGLFAQGYPGGLKAHSHLTAKDGGVLSRLPVNSADFDGNETTQNGSLILAKSSAAVGGQLWLENYLVNASSSAKTAFYFKQKHATQSITGSDTGALTISAADVRAATFTATQAFKFPDGTMQNTAADVLLKATQTFSGQNTFSVADLSYPLTIVTQSTYHDPFPNPPSPSDWQGPGYAIITGRYLSYTDTDTGYHSTFGPKYASMSSNNEYFRVDPAANDTLRVTQQQGGSAIWASGSVNIAGTLTTSGSFADQLHGVTFLGARTNAELRGLSCPFMPCMAISSESPYRIYIATAMGVNAWLSADGSTPGVAQNDVGELKTFAMSSCPTGYLAADGSDISTTTYSDLFAKVGHTYDTYTSSAVFKTPDMRGMFVRGYDAGAGVDPARVFGSTQADTMQGHVHTYGAIGYVQYDGGDGSHQSGTKTADNGTSDPVADAHGNGTPRTSAETRPKNIALRYCLKI